MTGDSRVSPGFREPEGPSPSRPTIGIVGHVGAQNLGDEAIIASVIQNIRRRWPEAVIRGFTSGPGDTEERHGIRSFPLRQADASQPAQDDSEEDHNESGEDRGDADSWRRRLKDLIKKRPVLFSLAKNVIQALQRVPTIGREVKFLLDSRQHVRELELLIFAGSHQLNDFVGGPWAYPYTVLKWSILAMRAGAKVVFLSMGAGPIETRLGRVFLRRALRLAAYRSYRDVTAGEVVDSLNVSETQTVVPDLAFGLRLPAISVSTVDRSSGPIVGLNPLPLYAEYWHISDSSKYEAYITKLARFSDWLIDRGCEVRFIPTQLLVDPAVIEDIQKRMTSSASLDRAQRDEMPSVQDLNSLIQALSEVDIMVATRYHGILLSLALHKPVLAIAYHQKSRDLMQWLGLGEYVVDGDAFGARDLQERWPSLEASVCRITASLEEQVPVFKQAVGDQYDEVFGLLASETNSPTSN